MAEPARSLDPQQSADRSSAVPWQAANESPLLAALLREVQGLREQLAVLASERPGTSTRDRERISLGRDAVLSLGRAVELLPLADGDARAWLREQRLVRTLQTGGRSKEVVCWGAVLDHLDGPSPPRRRSRQQPRRRGAGLPRVDLG